MLGRMRRRKRKNRRPLQLSRNATGCFPCSQGWEKGEGSGPSSVQRVSCRPVEGRKKKKATLSVEMDWEQGRNEGSCRLNFSGKRYCRGACRSRSWEAGQWWSSGENPVESCLVGKREEKLCYTHGEGHVTGFSKKGTSLIVKGKSAQEKPNPSGRAKGGKCWVAPFPGKGEKKEDRRRNVVVTYRVGNGPFR